MARCSCGAETSRWRAIYSPSGALIREECDQCAPNSFDPQWKTAKGAVGWEAYPTMYKKVRLDDGRVGYIGKDELRADTEAKLAKPSEDDTKTYAAAVARKRAHRRTKPLTKAEVENNLREFREAAQKQRALDAGLELPN